jgi:hypothetical protein
VSILGTNNSVSIKQKTNHMNPDINPAGSSSSPAPVTAPTTPAAQAATPTSPALQARPRFNRGNKKQQPPATAAVFGRTDPDALRQTMIRGCAKHRQTLNE